MSENRHLDAVRVLAPPARTALEALAAPPRFSIVIPAYQASATIGDAIDSALAQVHPAHEVIVVDDGSSDHLQGSLRRFGDRITLVRQTNRGAAAAQNAGAAAATGDFLATLDADDTYHPKRLQALAELACERPDLDLITTDATFVVAGEPVGSFRDYNPFVLDDQRTAILRNCFVGGWPAVRWTRLNEIGGFDESFRTGYDWDCWLRLILDGSRAGLIAEAYYNYVLHAGSLTSSRVSSLWDRVRLLEKASANENLRDTERPVLRRSLRAHRSHAVEVETKAVLFDAPARARLRELALLPQMEPRARLLAAFAVIAPLLARRLVAPEEPPEARFSTKTA